MAAKEKEVEVQNKQDKRKKKIGNNSKSINTNNEC